MIVNAIQLCMSGNKIGCIPIIDASIYFSIPREFYAYCKCLLELTLCPTMHTRLYELCPSGLRMPKYVIPRGEKSVGIFSLRNDIGLYALFKIQGCVAFHSQFIHTLKGMCTFYGYIIGECIKNDTP